MWKYVVCGLVTGLVLGFSFSIPWAIATVREENKQEMKSLWKTLLHSKQLERDCNETKIAAQEELRIANQLITQQGLAIMNCLMLRDPPLDSLLLPDPSLISPPPPAPSP